jgi:hypothetical protein
MNQITKHLRTIALALMTLSSFTLTCYAQKTSTDTRASNCLLRFPAAKTRLTAHLSRSADGIDFINETSLFLMRRRVRSTRASGLLLRE